MILFSTCDLISFSFNNQKNSPAYQWVSSHFNSVDYPNVVVVKISATPWNLVTLTSRFDLQTTVNMDSEGRIVADQAGIASRQSNTKLHLIDWDEGMIAQIRLGYRVKLLVSPIVNISQKYG